MQIPKEMSAEQANSVALATTPMAERLSPEREQHLRRLIGTYLADQPHPPTLAHVARTTTAQLEQARGSEPLMCAVLCDAGATIQVVSLANSPLYCPSRDALSVADAIECMGEEFCRELALSFVHQQAYYPSSPITEPVLRTHWRHSMRAIRCASELCHLLGEEAMRPVAVTAAAIARVPAALLAAALERGPSMRLTPAEQYLAIGMSNEIMAPRLSIVWPLPEPLAWALTHNPARTDPPADAPHAARLGRVLRAAYYLAGKPDYTSAVSHAQWRRMAELTLRALELDWEALAHVGCEMILPPSP